MLLDKRSRRLKKARNYTPYHKILEMEINDLRGQMEEAFAHSKCLTSEQVVASSMLLDYKINEYMRWKNFFSS